MPCHDYDSIPTREEIAAREEANQLRKRNDKLARVACSIEKVLTPTQIKILPKETQEWIRQHRIDDAKAAEVVARQEQLKAEEAQRKARIQMKRENALHKLTKEERSILGV